MKPREGEHAQYILESVMKPRRGEHDRTVENRAENPEKHSPLLQVDNGSSGSYCPGRGTSETRSHPSEYDSLRPVTVSGGTCAATGPFDKSGGWTYGTYRAQALVAFRWPPWCEYSLYGMEIGARGTPG